MDRFDELALESAEAPKGGLTLTEKRMSEGIVCISFLAESPFGDGKMQRGKGRYYTLLGEESVLEREKLSEEMIEALAKILRSLIPAAKRRRVLAVGLGNPAAVVDALGSETVKRLRVGAHRRGYLAAIAPSVFGVTGLESASVTRGVIGEFAPDLVICVDTLATRRAERLFRAMQITDCGILPGGGVGHRREMLTGETLGVPVLGVGVPLLAHADRLSDLPKGLVVTPKEIDLLVPLFADIVARGVEKALVE